MQPYYQQGYHAAATAATPYSSTSSPVPPSLMGQSQSSILAPPLSQHAFGELPPEQRAAAAAAAAAPPAQPQKRKQVKNACTNCQKACKKCDDARPCPRCIKYNIADTCVNSVRKERKKGVKRGPYKRRQKDEDGTDTQKAGTTKSASAMASHPAMGQTHMDPMAPYSSMRQPTTYTYANTLSAYGQGYGDTYNPYAAYQGKDQMMPHTYMIAPNVYSSFGYPMLVPGASDNQQQQQQQQQSQQQHQPQTTQSSQQAYTPSQSYNLSYSSPQPSRTVNDPLTQQQQSHQPQQQQQHQQPGSPAHVYYAQQHQQTQRHHPQQTSHSNSPHMLKPHPMTPLPSTSTSSSTSTPPEHGEDADATHYARLTQLCSAALGQNGDHPATPQSDSNHS